jgi:hypothetical protein
MLAPPCCPALTVLADQNSEPDTGTPIILLTVLAQRQHAIGQLVTHDAGRRRGNRSNSDRSWSRIAVLWCNYDPGAIGAVHITTVLVVVVAASSCLALCTYNRPSRTADNCANGSAAPAAERTSEDRPGGTAENRASDRILCRRVLRRESNGKAQQGRSPECSIHVIPSESGDHNLISCCGENEALSPWRSRPQHQKRTFRLAYFAMQQH